MRTISQLWCYSVQVARLARRQIRIVWELYSISVYLETYQSFSLKLLHSRIVLSNQSLRQHVAIVFVLQWYIRIGSCILHKITVIKWMVFQTIDVPIFYPSFHTVLLLLMSFRAVFANLLLATYTVWKKVYPTSFKFSLTFHIQFLW